jgi:predicted GIY-YIG superfamily endonuclease
MTVYLLHFAQPISPHHTAQHYIGFAQGEEALQRRLNQHRNGRGARFTQVAQTRKITFCVAQVWELGDRQLERYLKRQKNARKFCPLCTVEIKQKEWKKMHLNEYPQAIADVQKHLNSARLKVRQLKESVAVFESEIEQAIAFNDTLKNDTQRKAKRQELTQTHSDLITYKTQLAKAEAVEVNLEIELQLLLNQFSVLKLERREAIAQLELQSRSAA